MTASAATPPSAGRADAPGSDLRADLRQRTVFGPEFKALAGHALGPRGQNAAPNESKRPLLSRRNWSVRPSSDSLTGGEGDDELIDSPSGSRTPPTPEVNTLDAGPGRDDIRSGDGDDTINAGDGDDSISATGFGTDVVNGNAGADFMRASQDRVGDTYRGGTGNDTIDYNNEYDAAPQAISLDGAANDGANGENDNVVDTENVTSGEGDDVVIGNDAPNVVDSNGGNDTVSSAGGDDDLSGGSGNDRLAAGTGRDQLTGQSGDDVLDGDDGDDDLSGGGGADTFNGGLGDGDIANYARDTDANVTVTLDGIRNDGAFEEGDNADADGGVENVVTGEGNDTLTGNGRSNVIDSGPGNDVINARDGQVPTDLVACGPGFDRAVVDFGDSVETAGTERCEVVDRSAAPQSQGPTQTVPGPTQTVPGPTITQDPPRVSPRGLTALVSPSRDRKFPYRFTTRGTLSLPAGMSPAQGCKGTVAVQIKRGKKTISTRRVDVKPNCTYSVAATFSVKSRVPRRGTLKVRARFNGNSALLPARATEVRVRYGR